MLQAIEITIIIGTIIVACFGVLTIFMLALAACASGSEE